MALVPFVRPSEALADLRAFVATRTKQQWIFGALSLAIPFYFFSLVLLKTVEKKYQPPEVTFVTSYAKNRTDAEIRAQQEVDTRKLKAEKAARDKVMEERRRALAPITKKLDELGF